MVHLRLYVSGRDAASRRALAALDALQAALGPAAAEVEVVDVVEDPDRAELDRVTVTPTLVRVTPDVVSKIVGELPEPRALARHLGIEDLLDPRAEEAPA